MRILFLNGQSEPLKAPMAAELIVAQGYRHKVPETVLGSATFVNCHPSYLPYNRGAHPAFWALYDGTPMGVSVHYMDKGIDTGPLILRREVHPEPTDTLRANYNRLNYELFSLFSEAWPMIAAGYEGVPQQGGGTSHRSSDLPDWVDWDMTVAEVVERRCLSRA